MVPEIPKDSFVDGGFFQSNVPLGRFHIAFLASLTYQKRSVSLPPPLRVGARVRVDDGDGRFTRIVWALPRSTQMRGRQANGRGPISAGPRFFSPRRVEPVVRWGVRLVFETDFSARRTPSRR